MYCIQPTSSGNVPQICMDRTVSLANLTLRVSIAFLWKHKDLHISLCVVSFREKWLKHTDTADYLWINFVVWLMEFVDVLCPDVQHSSFKEDYSAGFSGPTVTPGLSQSSAGGLGRTTEITKYRVVGQTAGSALLLLQRHPVVHCVGVLCRKPGRMACL